MGAMKLPAVVFVALLAAGRVPGQVVPPIDPAVQQAVNAVDASRIEQDVRRLVGFGTRHTLSDTEDPDRGIGAARRWLQAEMERISAASGGRLQVSSETHQVPPGGRVPAGAKVVNVLAVLPGTDPDRHLIVSGHYDSRARDALDATSDAPGADDDASGCAVVLESARVLGGLQPRATIVFMLVAGEEQGLLGAAGHAKQAFDAEVNVEAMITNDIVGGVVGSDGQREPQRVRLFSEGVPSGPPDRPRRVIGSDNDAPSRQLARYLEAHGEAAVPGFDVLLIFRQDRYLRGGDHRAFNQLGYAGVRFTEPHENFDWQHQDVREENGRKYGDRADFVDWEYVARVARVNVAGLASLALAPPPPSSVRVMTASLSPDTELRWDPAGADLAHAVLARRTHEPTWTHRIDVPAGEDRRVLEGWSKDDWLFAVEAVDAAGHRSLPVYPTPARR